MKSVPLQNPNVDHEPSQNSALLFVVEDPEDG